MVELFHFVPKSEGLARNNVIDFIAQVREHYQGTAAEWNSAAWPSARFVKIGSPMCSRGAVDPQWVLDAEYMDFAKAYLWYVLAHNPRKNIGYIIASLRVLEGALLQVHQSPRVWLCNAAVLDEAALITSRTYSPGSAYSCSRVMMELASFLASRCMAKSNIKDWKTPLRHPGDMQVQIGPQANRIRANKLPRQEELNAIAEIFANDPELPLDRFTSCCFALLMCAPSRGSEVLALSVDAEIEERDNKGVLRYGWRFPAGKGFGWDIKWIPKSMEQLAKTAFARMKELSQPGRDLATWIEQHPDRFYRHSLCPDVDEDQPLSPVQAARALGFDQIEPGEARTRLYGRQLDSRDGSHTLRSLWQYTLARQPKDFPWYDQRKGVKYSQALCCMLNNQLHAIKNTIPIELHWVGISTLINDLGIRNGRVAYKGIFERHGYRRSDGEAMKLTTHQPRHLLNTLAQSGGLSQEEIAKWSGRRDVKQNRVYNHMPNAEIIADIRDALVAAPPPPSVSLMTKDHTPVTADEFASNRVPAVHVTEYGFCVHDFVISPCLKYRDCVNCTEQICVKGDQAKLARLRLRREQLQGVLSLALDTAEEGEVAADRWIEHHRMTIAHLDELIELLSSSQLADGALVRISGNDFSHIA
ncbi:integrase [Pseudomonas viridiflava]|uniref:integrase n=1 Tax=Pseudomonas viridiflava TaxID=33069 RepID=UPI000F065A6C|nr:integrase [Pseudomonas viridiflava]